MSETDPKKLISFSQEVEQRIKEQRKAEMTASWSDLLSAFMLASSTEILPLEKLRYFGQLIISGKEYPAMVNVQPYFFIEGKPKELIIDVAEMDDEETEGITLGKCLAHFKWTGEEFIIEDFDNSDEIFVDGEVIDSKKVIDCATNAIQQSAADDSGAELPQEAVFERLRRSISSNQLN
jgi:hypothetical protein